MNPNISIPSGNTSPPLTPNLDKADLEGKLNNYAVTKDDSVHTLSQGLVSATHFGESLEAREVSHGASADARISDIMLGILDDLDDLKKILIENDEHYGHQKPNPNIPRFEKADKLLRRLNPEMILKGEKINDGYHPSAINDGTSDTYYHVYYGSGVLFTVTRTDSESRFKEDYTTGESGAIETTELFDQLYSDFDERKVVS